MSARQPSDNSGVQRVCCSCGARGGGDHPAGWRIEPVYGHGALRGAIVGERPICPACQEGGGGTTMKSDQRNMRVAPPFEDEVTTLVTPIRQLMVAGNALAEILEDIRSRSDTESVEANALRDWERALAAVGKAVR